MTQIRRDWFLMNDIPAPYFAISARKIRYGAGGNVAKIRREGDNANQNFKFINNNLSASEIDAFIASGGPPENGYFKEWVDQLNPANKMLNTNEAWEPQYVAAAINGKIGFQSVIPTVTLGQLFNNTNLNKTTAATFFCVVDTQGNQGAAGAQPFGTNPSFTSDMFRILFIGTNYAVQGRDSLGNSFASPSVSNPSGKAIFIVKCDGVSNIKVWRNGVLGINYNVPGGFLNKIRKPTIGSHGGLFSEFLIFDTILNQDNTLRVEANENNYFSVF